MKTVAVSCAGDISSPLVRQEPEAKLSATSQAGIKYLTLETGEMFTMPILEAGWSNRPKLGILNVQIHPRSLLARNRLDEQGMGISCSPLLARLIRLVPYCG